jgi:hypothetical protein
MQVAFSDSLLAVFNIVGYCISLEFLSESVFK